MLLTVPLRRPTAAAAVQQTVCIKPGVHTNDFAPIYGRRAKKLGHASLATVFRHGRLTFQPILWENLEPPVLRYQPITTAVITDACLNNRFFLTRFNKIAIQGTPQMAVD